MTTPTSPSHPTEGNPVQDVISRSFVVEADARMLERMRKQAEARGFTIFCDERTDLGGDDSAPPPLAYFASSILF